MPGNILYIGSPLLDLSCTCEASFLDKYNLKPDDCVQVTDTAIFAELLSNPSLSITPGGSAQNSARVSKWLLQEKGQVSFAGCVGRDEYAERMKHELQEVGVNPLYYYHESLPTGLCACLIVEKEKRSMCTILGAAKTFSAKYLCSSAVQEKMSEADVIYVVGFFVSHSKDAVMKAAEYSHKYRKLFAINLSAVYVCSSHASQLMECMPLVDIVIGNEAEARAFVEALGVTSARNVRDCAKFIASLPKKYRARSRICVISQGAENVIVGQGNNKPKEFEVPGVEDIVDTIGCGDALVGGILAKLASGYKLQDAVLTGIETATLIAQTSGCTLPSGKKGAFSED